MTAPPTPERPRIVNVAFWLVLVGAVLLLAGGLLGVSTAFSTPHSAFGDQFADGDIRNILVLHGGIGVLCMAVGLVLSFLAGRARNGDARIRRVLVWLAVAIVVLIFLLALLAPSSIELPALFGVVPVALGATLFMRPGAHEWFEDVA